MEWLVNSLERQLKSLEQLVVIAFDAGHYSNAASMDKRIAQIRETLENKRVEND